MTCEGGDDEYESVVLGAPTAILNVMITYVCVRVSVRKYNKYVRGSKSFFIPTQCARLLFEKGIICDMWFGISFWLGETMSSFFSHPETAAQGNTSCVIF